MPRKTRSPTKNILVLKRRTCASSFIKSPKKLSIREQECVPLRWSIASPQPSPSYSNSDDDDDDDDTDDEASSSDDSFSSDYEESSIDDFFDVEPSESLKDGEYAPFLARFHEPPPLLTSQEAIRRDNAIRYQSNQHALARVTKYGGFTVNRVNTCTRSSAPTNITAQPSTAAFLAANPKHQHALAEIVIGSELLAEGCNVPESMNMMAERYPDVFAAAMSYAKVAMTVVKDEYRVTTEPSKIVRTQLHKQAVDRQAAREKIGMRIVDVEKGHSHRGVSAAKRSGAK